MNNAVRLFPVMDDAMREKAGISAGTPEFSYMLEEEECRLQLQDPETEDGIYSALLQDPKCSWFPDNNQLFVSCKINIDNPEFLLGAEGVAPEDAVLGLAVRWSSSGTEQQNTVPFGEISMGSRNVSAEKDLEFPAGFLKTSLRLEYVLYLKRPGIIKSGESHLCNRSGTVLGTIAVFQIYIDGNGSVFPIVTEDDREQPLWRIVQSSFDIMSDKFDEDNIAIYLNRAHSDFRFVSQDSPDYNISFFAEVLSDALTLLTESLISEAKEQAMWDDILKGENYEEDSIAAALHYFIRKLGWNPDNLLTLSESIHKYIDKNLKGELS